MDEQSNNLALFLFEINSLRKIARSHRQTLLSDDISDNIGSHSFMVPSIGIFLAEKEGVDIGKVVSMCVTHDWKETRSGDQNWIHKKYVSVDQNAIGLDQFGLHQSTYVRDIVNEYEQRESLESIIAKDADVIAQIILLKEYALQGNAEAQLWLMGKDSQKPYSRIDSLKRDVSKQLAKAIYDCNVSDWWKDSYMKL